MPGIDENTLLLLHGEELIDSSQYEKIFTGNNVVISTEQSKFGGKSLYFNGTNAYITLPVYNDMMFGGNDFTIDWWEYRTRTNGSIFNLNHTSGGFGLLCTHLDGTKIYTSSSGTTWDMFSGENAFSPTINQWTHWALVKNGNTWRTFKNGVKFWETTNTSSLNATNITGSTIGKQVPGSDYFQGYIDEFRISNVARWTSDFTPPDEAYTVSNLIEYTFTGLKNDVEYFARVYPMNLKGYAQSEITGQVASAMPKSELPITDLPIGSILNFNSKQYVKVLDNYENSGNALFLLQYLDVMTAYGNGSYGYTIVKAKCDEIYNSLSSVDKNRIAPAPVPNFNPSYLFLLSKAELGLGGTDGTPIPYLTNQSNRIAKLSDKVTNSSWWLRSFYTTSEAYIVDTNGAQDTRSRSAVGHYLRYAFCLKNTEKINSLPNPDGSYDLL